MKNIADQSIEITYSDVKAAYQWQTGSHDPAPSCDTSLSTYDGSREKENSMYRDPLCPRWTRFTDVLHNLIRGFVVELSGHATRHPKPYVFGLPILSLIMLAIGFFTNFKVETEYEIIYAPSGKRSSEYMDWIYRPETGFPPDVRPFTLFLHNQGDNVLTKQGIHQLFQALEVIKNTEGYDETCALTLYSMKYPNGTNTENTCNIAGSTRFWYYNQKLFEAQVSDDEQVVQVISNSTYPDGVPVNRDFVLGQYQWANQTTEEGEPILTFAKAYHEIIMFPMTDSSVAFEKRAIKNLRALQETWKEDLAQEEAQGAHNRTMQLEFFTMISYATEFETAIFKDLYLTGMVGLIMVAYCCCVFFKRDPVQSRCLLGIMAVFTIAMSIALGHGIMFAAGVPYTNMTMMLPFVVFGVGLDDTFISTGAFFRKSPKKDTVERIRETMEEVGSSIALTKITTVLSFALGYNSSIPAIQWLCLYSLISISLVFIFQITMFQAFMVLDEQRIRENRRDLCFWITMEREEEAQGEMGQESQTQDKLEAEKHQVEQVEDEPDAEEERSSFMTRYADFLMRPSSKAIVLATFLGYLGFCIYRATLLTQEFIISEFLPAKSYVADYLEALHDYATETVPMAVYFRNIDQSNETVQQQMRDYIDDLVNLEQLGTPPPFCWVRDMVNEEFISQADIGLNLSLLDFNTKLGLALSDPRIRQVYGDDIVRDEYGNITASRCYLFLRNVDFNAVTSQIKMLNDQNAVAAVQPINQGQQKFSMFAFTDLMFLWEFYSVCVRELTSTTIVGVVSMVAVAFLLIPHWTAAFYVGTIISMLNVEMLGTIQLAGLHINAVTYVCLTVSIGLLVDYLMHIMLRYNESKELLRENKVKDTLETMGVSILTGGLSTFLAVIPLAFSTSAIIGEVFTSFFIMVTLGVAHGLIFLPVVLSIIGPTKFSRSHSPSTTESKDAQGTCESSLSSIEDGMAEI